MEILNSKIATKAKRPERIVQFGEGNFLRGFFDWMAQRMNASTDFNSSVVIVQPRVGGHVDRLQAQDCLYNVNIQGLMNGETIDSITQIDCISRTIDPYKDFEAYRDLASVPELRFVVSNTTEAGITFDPSARFDAKPAVSFPAKLTQLLYFRYKAFDGDKQKGLIIFPCELIYNNGRQLSECIHKHIAQWSAELGNDAVPFEKWVEEACPICTTLVDRIVPGFPKSGVEELQQRIGAVDNQLVQGEPYHLWVIETSENITIDQLSKEFPAREAELNVILTNDESPYHVRKVTLLNGPHTVLAPVAYLSGIDIVRDACNHPLVGKFIREVMFDELLPTLDMPREELMEYAESVLERFRNPYINHQVTSIMLNSFSKFCTRDLPALRKYYETNHQLPRCIVLGLAAICVCYQGVERTDGSRFTPSDNESLETVDLSKVPGLAEMLSEYIDMIKTKGMLKVLENIYK